MTGLAGWMTIKNNRDDKISVSLLVVSKKGNVNDIDMTVAEQNEYWL